MNTDDPSQQPCDPVRAARGLAPRKRGVALILAVSFIVLLSALMIGFFSRVSSDLAGARSYSEGVTVRQLADSAVGTVMGQIRAATTVPNGCWASQPGAIRVYGSAGGQAGAQAYAIYKLYSSHSMVVAGSDLSNFDPSDTSTSGGASVEVPMGSGGWTSQPAFFTDVNEPVDIPDPSPGAAATATVKRYPIFDPSVARITAKGQHTSNNSAGFIEGSEVTLGAGIDLERNNAPMPVRWMYVLRDGTLTAPTPVAGAASGPAGLRATWGSSSADGTTSGIPTKDNPIVGRIAYWTDDDTCKININTAGGFLLPDGMSEDILNYKFTNTSLQVPDNAAFYAGSFWDTPRVQTRFDRGVSGPPVNYRPGLANSQPVRNEFQRYPGHPSTTSLGIVFKNFLAGSGLTSEKLYRMTPRLLQGASQGGTKQLIAYDQQLDPTVFGIDPDPPLSIKKTYGGQKVPVPSNPTDADLYSFHLFGSVDELLYTSKNGLRELTEKVINLNPNSLTAEKVDKARFFLTAHSRAPELNLFGRPRVTVWPVPSVESEGNVGKSVAEGGLGIRNPTDDLIRFCSTIGRNPSSVIQRSTRQGEFIFDRHDALSPTTDFLRARNSQVFRYLTSLTSATQGRIPGWGTSFEGKYGAAPGKQVQLLAEIFDYIRSVNLKDTSRDQRIDAYYGRKNPAQKIVPAAQKQKAIVRYAKDGIVVPTRIPTQNLSGFGRFPSVSEVSLVFYHGGYVYTNAQGAEAVEYDYRVLPKPNDPPGQSDWEKKGNNLKAQLMRAFLIVETFNPMQGYGPVTNLDSSAVVKERIVYDITQLNPAFKVQTRGGLMDLKLGIGQNNVWRSSGSTWAGRNFGGTEGFYHTMQDKVTAAPPSDPRNPPYPGQTYYPFQTPCLDPLKDGIRMEMDEKTFGFKGGQMRMEIRYRDLAQDGLPPHNELVQALVLQWPDGTDWPVPITEREAVVPGQGFRLQSNLSQITDLANNVNPDSRYDFGGFIPTIPGFNSDDPNANWGTNTHKFSDYGGMRIPYFLPLRIRWVAGNSYSPWFGVNNTLLNSAGTQVSNGKRYANRFLQILQPGDTIRSLVPGGSDGVASDPRVTHLQSTVTTFGPHPDYNKATADVNLKRRAQTLRRGDGGFYFDPTNPIFFPGEQNNPSTGFLGTLTAGVRYAGSSGPDLPKGVIARRPGGTSGNPASYAPDFDTGIGNLPDGPFAGKADEGNVARSWKDEWGNWNYIEPYFSSWAYDAPGDTYFSPNRQLPSAVMFGSLLAPQTANWGQAGWKTLLFRPSSPQENHLGAVSPPDHLLLDLFTMPVVEPYAISEPFSTAGKVNMNYELMPFGYIRRSTALRAALHPVRVTAIPNNFTRTVSGVTELRYKARNNDENLRYLVDRDETIKSFDAFFADFKANKNKGFFKSASEICDRYLYPKGPVFSNQPQNANPPGSASTYVTAPKYAKGESPMSTWWAAHTLTGDNVREKPYADLLPRLTTKSNTYTVHYRVQTLRQRPYTASAGGEAAYYKTWDESRDQVLSEFRGHTTIERYLDPEDSRFQPNHQPASERIKIAGPADVEGDSLETAYRFRVIYNKRFSPW